MTVTNNALQQRRLAPAKINLFLHVVGRRPDGYHLLQSVFELIDWFDEISFDRTSSPDIVREGDLLGPESDDLAVRAARALQATAAWTQAGRPGVVINVRKSIPAGAGLGGGSSDAAATLMGLNALWQLGLEGQALSEIGLQLGADVPFFLVGQSAFAEGVGERLVPITSCPRWVVVGVPKSQVATGPIFQAPELTRNSKPLKIADFAQFALNPVWDFGRNDLEPVTRARFSEVDQVLRWFSMAAEGEKIAPNAVRMSGSGGAVFCTAPTKEIAEQFKERVERFEAEFHAKGQGRCLGHLRICQSLPSLPKAGLVDSNE
jgi:4-diphosphocytidyl-2-C-methyl-D-erythritol kinase